MKKLILLATLILASTGCRSYYYARTEPNGVRHEVWIQSFGTDAGLSRLRIDSPVASVELEGYSQQVNTEMVESITAGVVEGIGKIIVP